MRTGSSKPLDYALGAASASTVIAGLAGLLHHLQMPVDLRLLLPELLCLLLAAVLFVINERRKPREALNMLVYGLIIWYCLFMSNVWLYAIDDFSRERLVMLLLAVFYSRACLPG